MERANGWDSKLPKDNCLCRYSMCTCHQPHANPKVAWLSQAGLGDVAPMPYLIAWWKQGRHRMNRWPELICCTSAAMFLVKPDPSHILQSGIIPPPTCADTSTLARKHKHECKQSKSENKSQRIKLAFQARHSSNGITQSRQGKSE